MNINRAWCFTGHRPNKLYGYDKYDDDNVTIRNILMEQIIYCIENYNAKYFISGMALGTDMWAAEIVIELRKSYPDIKLVAAIPFIDHKESLLPESQIEWQKIIDEANLIHYVNKGKYNSICLQKRNEWMVDNSIGQIAVWDGSKGGTYNCVQYAKKMDKVNAIVINPKTFEVRYCTANA
jgi:uncharacterized phage-like protein YoqJ